MFGYVNENWFEEPNVSVGENNFFSPVKLIVTNPLFSSLPETAPLLKS